MNRPDMSIVDFEAMRTAILTAMPEDLTFSEVVNVIAAIAHAYADDEEDALSFMFHAMRNVTFQDFGNEAVLQ